MERIKDYTLRCFVSVMLLLISNITAYSSTIPDTHTNYDSVHISLLTCSPHQEVYSLYGHTAIRYENKAENQDFVINYGIFNFREKFFILRFTFGITDYSMGVVPFYYFVNEYQRYGSGIIQQEINLTPSEKEAVTKALQNNYLPENRIYRYNYFYKNCSTMARDIITNNIKGRVIYPEAAGSLSFREMIHACNTGYPWARLGNDMLLGAKADLNTTEEERHFIPANLKNDFEKALIERNGVKYPLVKSTKVLLQPGTQSPMEGFPMTPLMCSSIMLVICAVLVVFEHYRRRVTLWFDALMMTLTGIAGIIIMLMFFSEHPTTSTNLLILMLNPLPLFFLYRIFKASELNNRCIWWKIWLSMSLLTIFPVSLFQYIDASMYVIALIILIRSVQHLLYERKMKLAR